jgi:hypothetical protein
MDATLKGILSELLYVERQVGRRVRFAHSIAAEVAATGSGSRVSLSQRLWDEALGASLVVRQTLETSAGVVEVRCVQPGGAAVRA